VAIDETAARAAFEAFLKSDKTAAAVNDTVVQAQANLDGHKKDRDAAVVAKTAAKQKLDQLLTQ
jgi:hypothetical protein